jgi:hypothetical protein
MSDEIYTYSDIKPAKKDLRRLVDRGEKGRHQWWLDGKFVGTAKPNALKQLKRKLYSEYMDNRNREK